MLGNLVLGFGNQFGGSGWSWRAQVGYEVGDGEVGLMAYRGDDREAARCNRTGDALAVEGGHVFERPSAAGEDNHVHKSAGVQFFESGFYLGRRGVSLHADRADEDAQAGVAAGDDIQEIANHSAGGRGDDSHGAGKGGQRPLALRVKEALGLKTGLELLEGQLERARADRLHRLGHELHLSSLLVDAAPAAHQHVQTILGTEAQQDGLAAEEHNRELGGGILEREVDVAGGSGAVVGDLALDPDVAVFLLDEFADLADQFAHRPDAARGSRLVEPKAELGAEAGLRREWIFPGHY